MSTLAQNETLHLRTTVGTWRDVIVHQDGSLSFLACPKHLRPIGKGRAVRWDFWTEREELWDREGAGDLSPTVGGSWMYETEEGN